LYCAVQAGPSRLARRIVPPGRKKWERTLFEIPRTRPGPGPGRQAGREGERAATGGSSRASALSRWKYGFLSPLGFHFAACGQISGEKRKQPLLPSVVGSPLANAKGPSRRLSSPSFLPREIVSLTSSALAAGDERDGHHDEDDDVADIVILAARERRRRRRRRRRRPFQLLPLLHWRWVDGTGEVRRIGRCPGVNGEH